MGQETVDAVLRWIEWMSVLALLLLEGQPLLVLVVMAVGSGQWLVAVVVIDSSGVGRMVLRKTLVVPEDNRRQESTLAYHGCDIVNADELCGRRQRWCHPGRGMIVFNLVFPSWAVWIRNLGFAFFVKFATVRHSIQPLDADCSI